MIAEWIIGKLIATPVIGTLIKGIGGVVLDWRKQTLDAQGSHEAQVSVVVAKAIELDKREAELNAATVVAEQGNWVTRSIRPLLALPVIILMWKLLVWDKALGQWTGGITDSLSDQIWWYCTTVTIAYFGGRTVEKVAEKISGIWKK
jgi:hypothetical protein